MYEGTEDLGTCRDKGELGVTEAQRVKGLRRKWQLGTEYKGYNKVCYGV